MNMITLVARAIYAELKVPGDPTNIADAPPEVQEMMNRAARAAIEAMAEPTVEMWGDAGAEALNRYIGADPSDRYHGTADWALECWDAMIRAANA